MWQNGRRLTSVTTGGKTTTYAYDADGIRTTKVVGGVTHEYLTLNGKVVYEKIGTGNTAKIMIFTYDGQGKPFAVKYSKNNGASFTNYFYALNLQGDVVKIFRPNAVKDADGTTIGYTERTYATYSYNAWGELIGITDSNGNSILNKQTTSTALANLNPLRYRGYYYDNETGFYYLQSRYYDPANRRFINADVFTSTNSTDAISCNMFAYCKNSPISGYDPSGEAMVHQNLTSLSYFNTELLAESKALYIASFVGAQASVSMDGGKGAISIDLETYYSQLCAAADVIGWSRVCDSISASACRKFARAYNREFILSDNCVSNEIEDHIYAYQWEIGDRFLPNIIVLGALITDADIYRSCACIDIREREIDFTGLQALAFGYMYGIRDWYLNTEYDIYRYSRLP